MPEAVTFTPEAARRIVGAVRRIEQPGAVELLPRRRRAPAAAAAPWIGEIQTAGPAAEPDYTDERYWVREVSAASVADDRITEGYRQDGRWITATNWAELGLDAAYRHLIVGPNLDAGGAPAAKLPRVAVWRMAADDGALYYAFFWPPAAMFQDRYYLDARGLNVSNCVDDAKWWRGIVLAGVYDGDAPPP